MADNPVTPHPHYPSTYYVPKNLMILHPQHCSSTCMSVNPTILHPHLTTPWYCPKTSLMHTHVQQPHATPSTTLLIHMHVCKPQNTASTSNNPMILPNITQAHTDLKKHDTAPTFNNPMILPTQEHSCTKLSNSLKKKENQKKKRKKSQTHINDSKT